MKTIKSLPTKANVNQMPINERYKYILNYLFPNCENEMTALQYNNAIDALKLINILPHPQGITPDQLKEYREWLQGELSKGGKHQWEERKIALQEALDKLNQMTK